MRLTVFILCLLMHIVFGESSNTICSRKRSCKSTEKFKYEPKTSYIYEYQSKIVTKLNGVADETAEVTFTATTEFQAISSCEFSLIVNNIKFHYGDVDPNDPNIAEKLTHFANAIKQNPLRFGFQDGLVTDVCPVPEEVLWVLNLKKGILSMFQNTMNGYGRRQFVDELDILGNCKTEYFVTEGWRAVVAERVKDLTKCTDRQIMLSILQASPLANGMIGNSMPVLKGQQKCQQIISKSIFKDIVCDEYHLLRPFSGTNNTGALITAHQELHFVTTKSFEPSDPRIVRKSNLLFDYHLENKNVKLSFPYTVHQTLNKFCEHINSNIQKHTPQLFATLVQDLHLLKSSDLASLFESLIHTCDGHGDKIKNIFLDALIHVGTDEAFKFMTMHIILDLIDANHVKAWLTHLGLQIQPSLAMIEAVTPLLNFDDMLVPKYLGVSSLVSMYCRNDPDCRNKNEVRAIIEKLETTLGANCFTENPEMIEKIMLVLKALGNIGHFVNGQSVISQCYNYEHNPVRLRLAAIQAFRHHHCDSPRNDLLAFFLNENENSELRIAAYLEVMRCVRAKDVVVIEESLKRESVNQVGSFVWSHLTNIQESADLCKSKIQGLLANVELQKKFSADFRKFSQAYEKSFFSEMLNFGGHLDGNIVYSTKSFIPRSAMLNLTVDIFGRSVNLFEVSGYAEGMERTLESFFGPRGLFPQRHVHDTLRAGRERWKSVDENKLNQISEKQREDSSYFDEPYLSASVKILGNELRYWSFQGEQSIDMFQGILDLRYILTRLAEERKFEYVHHTILLDSHLAVATGVGFPLVLTLNSTASLKLDVAGRIDFRRLAVSSCEIDGHIHPSATVDVHGLMTIDLNVAKIGLHFQSVLHTSTILNGKLEIRGGEIVQLQLNFPQDKLEVVSIKNRIFLMKGEEKLALSGIQKDRTDFQKCSINYTSTPLGFEICGELRYPNASRVQHAPYFPLTGPIDVGLYLAKTDRALTNYFLAYRWTRHQITADKYLENFLLTFKTPRSTEDREWTVEFILNQPDESVSFQFITPFKRITCTGKYSNKPDKKTFDATVIIDQQKYFVYAELNIERSEKHVRFLPKLLIRLPERPFLSLGGEVYFELDRKLTFNLQLDHLTEKPIVFKGEITKTEKKNIRRVDWTLNFDSPFLVLAIKGYITGGGQAMTMMLTIDYSWMNAPKERFEFSMKFRNLSPPSRSLTRLTATAIVQFSAYPDYNIAVNWEFLTSAGHLENLLLLGFGVDAQLESSKICFQQILSYSGTHHRSNSSSNITGSFIVKSQVHEIDFQVHFTHHKSRDLVRSQLAVRPDSKQEFALLAVLNDESQTLSNITINFELKMPIRTILATIKIEEKKRQQFYIDAKAEWDHNKTMFLTALYENNSTRVQLSYSLKANITTTSNNTYYITGRFFAAQNLMLGNIFVTAFGDLYGIEANLTRIRRGRYQLKTDVVWENYTYSAVATLNMGNEILATLDLYSGFQHKISSRVMLRIYDDVQKFEFEFHWNIDVKRRTFIFSVENKKPKLSEHKVEVKMIHPDWNIVVNFYNLKEGSSDQYINNKMFKTVIGWNSEKQITFQININNSLQNHQTNFSTSAFIKTPFENWESIEIFGSSITNNTHRIMNGIVRWSPQHSVSANLEIKSIRVGFSELLEIKFNVETPFNGYESINAHVSHSEDLAEIKIKFDAHWTPDRKVTFAFELADYLDDFVHVAGGINLTTPWPGIRLVGIGVRHIFLDDHINSAIEIDYEDYPKFLLSLNGTYISKDEDTSEWIAEMYLLSPFRGYEDIKFELNHTVGANVLFCELTLKWPNDNVISLLVNAKLDFVGNSCLTNVDVQFSSPFSGIEHLKMKANTKTENLNVNFSFFFSWAELRQLEITFNGWSNSDGLEWTLVATTPWGGYKIIKIAFHHHLDAHQLKFYLHLAKEDVIASVDISGKYILHVDNYYITGGKVDIQLPIEALKKFKLLLMHSNNDVLFKTNGECIFNEHKLFHLFLIYWNILNFNGTANLNMTGILNPISFETKQEYKTFFDHSTVLNWGKNKNVSLNMMFSRPDEKNTNVYFTFEINKEQPIAFTLRYSMEQQSNYSLVTNACYNQQRIEFNTQLHLARDFNSAQLNVSAKIPGYDTMFLKGSISKTVEIFPLMIQIDAQWAPNKIVAVSAILNFMIVNPSFRVLAMSPFTWMRSLELHGKFIAMSEVNTVIFVYRRNDEHVDVSVSWFIDELYFKVDARLKTSFHILDDLTLTLKWDFSKPKKEIFVSFQQSELKTTFINLKVEYSSWKSFSASAELKSPLRYFQDVNLELYFENVRNTYEGKLSVKWNEDFASDGYVNLKFDSVHILPLELLVDCKLPVSIIDLQRFRIFLTVTRQAYKTVTSITVEWNNKRLDVLVELMLRTGSLDFHLKLVLPIEKYEVFEANCSLLNNTFNIMTAQVALRTPFEFLPLLKINSELRLSDVNSINGTLQVVTSSTTNKFTFSYLHVSYGNTVIKLKVESPIIMFGNASLDLNIFWISDNFFEINGILHFRNVAHALTGNFEQTNSHYKGFLQARNSRDVHELSVSLLFKETPQHKFHASFIISSNDKVHSFIVEVKGNAYQNGEARMEIKTPALQFQSLVIVASFKNDNTNSELNFQVEHEKESFHATLVFRNIEWSDTMATITLETPYSNFEHFKLYGRWKKVAWRLFEAEIDAETSLEGYRLMGVNARIERFPGRSGDFAIHLRTPFENYSVISLSGSVFYSSDFSSIQSRFTLTLPNRTINVYDEFIFTTGRVQKSFQIEYGLEAKYHLHSYLIYRMNLVDIFINATTPLKNFETVHLSGKYHLGHEQKHNLFAELKYPDGLWILNSEVETDEFPDFSLHFTLNTPLLGFENIGVKVEQQIATALYYGILQITYLDKQSILLHVDHNFQNHEKLGSIEANSPFLFLQHGQITYRYQYIKHIFDLFGSLAYNNVKLFQLHADLRQKLLSSGTKNLYKFELLNPFQPLEMSGSVLHNLDNDNVYTNELCWDLEHRDVACLKGELLIYRNESCEIVKIKTTHPTRIMTVVVQNKRILNVFQQEFDFKWNASVASNPGLNYQLINENLSTLSVTKYKTFFAVHSPLRRIELIGNYSYNGKILSIGSNVFLDAARNRENYFDIIWNYSNYTNRNEVVYANEVLINHPNSDKMMKLYGNITAGNIKVPFAINVEADYSATARETFSASVFVRNDSASMEGFNYNCGIQLVHLASDLDFLLKSQWKDDSREKYFSCQSTYLNERNNVVNYQLSGNILKNSHEATLELNLPDKLWETTFKYVKLDDNYVLNATHKENEKDSFIVHFFGDPKVFDGQLYVLYHPDEYEATYNIKSGFENPTVFEFKAIHNYDEDTYQDAYLAMKLINPYYAVFRLLWRHEALNEIKIAVEQSFNLFTHKVQHEWNTIKRSFWFETEFILEQFAKSVNTAFNVFTQDTIATISKALREDMDQLFIILDKIYVNNAFYLKDIISWSSNVKIYVMNLYNDLLEIIDTYKQQLKHEFDELMLLFNDAWLTFQEYVDEYFEDFISYVINFISQLAATIRAIYEKSRDQIIESVYGFGRGMKRFCIDLWKELMKLKDILVNAVSVTWHKIREGIQFLLETWRNFKAAVIRYYNQILDWIRNHPVYIEIRSWVLYFRDLIVRCWNELVAVIRRHIEKFRVAFIDNEKSIIGYIVKQCRRLYSILKGYWEKFINHPVVVFSKNLVLETYYKFQWFLDYYELRMSFMTMIVRTYQTWQKFIQKTGYQTGIQFDSLNRVQFTPNLGQIKMDQFLPFPWYSLNTAPQVDQMPEVQLYRRIKNWIYGPKVSIWELYYKYRPYLVKNIWLPPFQAYAIQSGDHDFITFDGKYMSFAGECSYLLAHNFINENLTITINYDAKGSKRFFTFLINDKEVNLTDEAKVLVNGKQTELPTMVDKVYFTRDNEVITILLMNGVMFHCNIEYQTCVLSIDGWDFGKTVGLLGTYNNEPEDDYKFDHNGRSYFGQYLEIGATSCKSQQNRAPVHVSGLAVDQVPDVCASYFQNLSSPFRYCFDLVDPNPYVKMCSHNVLQESNTEHSICASASAYVSVCHHVGIPIRHPRTCVRCLTHDGSVILEGTNITIQDHNVKPTADVVLIVEAKYCNEQLKNAFPELIKHLENSLVKTGLEETRYSVVAYGGDGMFDEPSTQTADGEIFGNKQSVLSALNNIAYGNGIGDLFEALRFASNLPFRIGSSRTFILFVCTKCQLMSRGVDYPEIHWMIREHGISIHLMLKHDFKIKRTRDFYGIDKNFAYTIKDAQSKKLIGDKALRRQIAIPKYVCLPLALESNGTVFSIPRMLDGRRRTKNFLQVFSKRVAVSARPPSCQACDCVADNHGVGKMHCQPCMYSTSSAFFGGTDIFGSYDDEDDFENDYDDYDIGKGTTVAIKNTSPKRRRNKGTKVNRKNRRNYQSTTIQANTTMPSNM